MSLRETDQKRAYVYALAAVVFWATDAAAFKLSLRYVPAISLLLYASLTSTAVVFVCLVAAGRSRLLKALTRRDCLRSAVLGFLNPFLYYLVLFKAYGLLPAQQAMTLNWVWPIVLVLLSIPILGQKIKAVSIVAMLVSFSGVFFIATAGRGAEFRFSNPAGVSLALGSTAIWAVFWIHNVKDRLDGTLRLFLNFAFGSLYILFFSAISGTLQIPPVRGLAGAVYVGMFEMGITYVVWIKALRLAKTTAHVASLVYLVPFLSLVVISAVVGERILPFTVIGLILIIAGIAMQKLLG